MRDELLNETIFDDLDHTRSAWRDGPLHTIRSASPQRASGCATPTSSADRPLLRRRSCANLNPSL
jgi:putative transposase